MDIRSVSMEFRTLWDNEIKEIAVKCAPLEIFHLIVELENTKDEEKKMELSTKLKESGFKDLTGLFYIGHMILDVERSLLRGKYDLNTINSTGQIQGTLKNSSSYWHNVWGNDFSSEEVKNLKQLGEVIGKLVHAM